MVGRRRVLIVLVVGVLIGVCATSALGMGSRLIVPRSGDRVLAKRIDLECLYIEGTTSGTFICNKRTEPKESVYVEFTASWLRIMRAQGGGLRVIGRYRR